MNFLINPMTTSNEELHKLRSIAEKSLNKTAQLHQVLAQIEASLLRTENEKIIQRNNLI